MNQNFENVSIHKTVKEQARFLAKLQDRSMSSVIEELIERVFQIAMSYEKQGVNIDFETCVSDSTLLVTVTGKNRLVSGSFDVPSSTSNKSVDRQIKKRLKKND